MEISEKLLELRTSSGKSQAEFAKLAGVSQRTWSSYESGQTTPKMGILWALAANGYPIPGLTTGLTQDLAAEGKVSRPELEKRLEIARSMADKAPSDTPVDNAWAERVNTEYRRQTGKNSLKVYDLSELPPDSFIVPLLDQRLSAGSGSYAPDEEEAKALIKVPSYLAQYGEHLAALTVDGDSMEPTLHRGDMVVCDSMGWSGEGIYALLISGDGFVKRITKAPGKVVIISDNPKYPVREEPEESQDLHIIGRVHCAITKVE
ncbi:MAG: helix-turn-helix domain-containing protein [Treponema sp.]|nr:helix-turn-helix domain-containing protein [Treponema sp.]